MKNVYTIEEVVTFAEKAADDTYNGLIEAGGTTDEAAAAASAAFRIHLPTLSSIGAVQAHLATIARGIERGFLSHSETRLRVAIARTWLAAHEVAHRMRRRKSGNLHRHP